MAWEPAGGARHRTAGRNTWLNTVAAGGGRNQRKGDRTPAEARMPLRATPHVPSWAALVAR
jgi:hypothetical protein